MENFAKSKLSKGAGECFAIGLDVAWFGGSKSNKLSQFDWFVWAKINDKGNILDKGLKRVRLKDRDLDGEQSLSALSELIKGVSSSTSICLAIDAPLLAKERGLPKREPKSKKGEVTRRICDEQLETRRKELCANNKELNEWRPNIQPGAPVPERIKKIVQGCKILNLSIWTKGLEAKREFFEVFPAEAIFFCRYFNGYKGLTLEQVKRYKPRGKAKKSEKLIKPGELKKAIRNCLFGLGKLAGLNSDDWTAYIDFLYDELTTTDDFKKDSDGNYSLGKFVDDSVDSSICLAVAISHWLGKAHVWDGDDDGHIIGPGN